MFWCLAPFLVCLMIVIPIAVRGNAPAWTATRLAGVLATEIAAMSLLLFLWNSNVFWWAGRLLGATIFLACLAYLVSMVVEGRFQLPRRRAETSVWNAALAMLLWRCCSSDCRHYATPSSDG